jgi:hypothetical protein
MEKLMPEARCVDGASDHTLFSVPIASSSTSARFSADAAFRSPSTLRWTGVVCSSPIRLLSTPAL